MFFAAAQLGQIVEMEERLVGGALAGDSHAALFGHAIFTPGAVKAAR